MFFVERAQQIADFVKAVTESIGAIARGSLGGAAQRVEDALARAIPVAIGFLASLLGLDDLSETIAALHPAHPQAHREGHPLAHRQGRRARQGRRQAPRHRQGGADEGNR